MTPYEIVTSATEAITLKGNFCNDLSSPANPLRGNTYNFSVCLSTKHHSPGPIKVHQPWSNRARARCDVTPLVFRASLPPTVVLRRRRYLPPRRFTNPLSRRR
ncbi:hypothetical protein Bbelb_148210 [Branchiostoma belcheri]|nr:hypothetical protein Bbelb_148210 [Branchiostoma belcheri]